MIDAVIMGAAIADVLLYPATEDVFRMGSYPAESVRMSVGGDAINEATILARLGHAPMLATKLGCDGIAGVIEDHCEREGVALHAVREPNLDTGVNVVLVSPSGERSFITNRNGSLRRLSMQDLLPTLETQAFEQARVVCLASMFVSPQLTLEDMETLFARVKAAGKCLCADTTKRKNGETLSDAAGALQYVDYFFPNLEEAKLLTGLEDPEDIADALLNCGVKNVALKLGGEGCLLKNDRMRQKISAWPGTHCIDTTGAGDNFAAGFIAALLEGESFLRCGAFANATASICVESLGATTAQMNRAEVERRRDEILLNIRNT